MTALGVALLVTAAVLMVGGFREMWASLQHGRKGKELAAANFHGDSAREHGAAAARALTGAFLFIGASLCSGTATLLL